MIGIVRGSVVGWSIDGTGHLPRCEKVSEIGSRALDHLALDVRADDVGADETGFDQEATRPAHRIEEYSAWSGIRNVDHRTGEQRIHASRLEERLVRRHPAPEVTGAFGREPAQRAHRNGLKW